MRRIENAKIKKVINDASFNSADLETASRWRLSFKSFTSSEVCRLLAQSPRPLHILELFQLMQGLLRDLSYQFDLPMIPNKEYILHSNINNYMVYT